MKTTISLIVATAVIAFALTPVARATDYSKANNTTALNLPGSWALGTVPTATDRAVWDNTVTGANDSPLGANTNWDGIVIDSPGGAVTIGNNNNTLTLGALGIDMSVASQNLLFNCGLAIGASQTWDVDTNLTLVSPANAQPIITNSLTITGGGTVVFTNFPTSSTSTGPITNTAPSLVIFNLSQGNNFNNPVAGNGLVIINTEGQQRGPAVSWPNFTGTLVVNSGNGSAKMTAVSGFTLGGGIVITNGNQLFANGAVTINGNGSILGGNGDTENRGVIRAQGNIIFNGTVLLANDNPGGADGGGVPFNGSTFYFNGVIDDGNPGGTGYGINNNTPNGSANIVLAAANTYHGLTRLNGGDTLTVSNQFALQNSTLYYTAATLAFAQNVTAHAFIFGGLAGTAGFNLKDNGNNPIALTIGNNNSSTNYSGVLASTGSLIKVGTGTQTNSGASTYTGTTTINGGMLSIGADGGASGPLGAAPGTATVADLVLNGGALSASASFTLNANRGIALGPTGSGGIDVVSGQTLIYNGIAADNGAPGSLTKTSAGTLSLGGANSYTGNTIINGGTLALAGSGSLSGSTSLTIAAGGTFDVSAQSGTYTVGGSSITNSGAAAPATINGPAGGNVNLGSLPITLNYDGSDPALTIAQGTLELNGNTFTVNSASQLGIGTYTLVTQASGSINSSGTLAVGGTAIGANGTTASIAAVNGNVVLTIASSVSYSSYSITGGGSLAAGGNETITITAVDINGNPVTSVTGPVSLRFRGLSTSPNGTVPTIGGANEGTLTALTFTAGVATANLAVANAESATLQVTDGSHDSGTSPGGAGLALNVSVGAAARLGILANAPATATAGVTLTASPVIVVQDAEGNTVLTSVASISVAASSGNATGTTSVNADGITGGATFSNLALTGAGSVTLTFSSPGLAATNSSAITVSANVAAQLGITTQPSATAISGVAFGTQPAIAVLDAYGNIIGNSTASVTAAEVGGGGTLQGTTTINAASGLAVFSGLSLTNIGNATLTFTSSGLAATNSTAISVSGGPVVAVAWTTQPGSAVNGTPFGIQPVLKTVDQYGNPSTSGLSANQIVTVTSSDETLTGTTVTNIGTAGANGVAQFTDLQINTTGNSTLQASVALNPANLDPSTFGSFSNCKLWLDASDTSTLSLSGSAVTTWGDRSGNSDNATVAGGTPTLATDAALTASAAGGAQVVNFAGGTFNVNLAFLSGTPYTIITLEVLNSGNGYFLGTAYNGTDATLAIGYEAENDFRFQQYADDVDYLPGANFAYATPRLWTTENDTNKLESIHLNGTLENSRTANAYLGTLLQGTVGSGNYDGDIAEVLVYNKGLSDAERTAVENYLTTKWLTAATTVTATTAQFAVGNGSTPPPPPPQSITSITASGGVVTITYNTTVGASYHIASTPSLASPVAWTPVPDSQTNDVTGTSVSYNFTPGSSPQFYETVSP